MVGKYNSFIDLCRDSEACSYVRPIDFCLTLLQAQNNKEEEEGGEEVLKAHALLYHSTLNSRAIKKKVGGGDEIHPGNARKSG